MTPSAGALEDQHQTLVFKTKERAAYDAWFESRPLGSDCQWSAWDAACDWKKTQVEHVGWQHRLLDPLEGPGIWLFCDAAAAALLRHKKHYEVRPVFAPVVTDRVGTTKDQPSATPVADLTSNMLVAACRIGTDQFIHRYLMSCSAGREDGALKAVMHRHLCEFYVAVYYGYADPDQSARKNHPACKAVHRATQEGLTDYMDEVIGFPINGRPDYDKLGPAFFDKFHAIAVEALKSMG